MKLVALLAILIGAFAAQQSDQVGVGKADVFVSKSSVVPLTHTATVALMEGRNLQIEPGVRMTRLENGYSLATYDGRKVEIEAGADRFALASPILAHLTERGWDFGDGRHYSAAAVTARRHQQDDADNNLKSMQEAAKKLKTDPKNQTPNKKLRVRFLYGESNPMVTADLFNSTAIIQLTHCSPNGF